MNDEPDESPAQRPRPPPPAEDASRAGRGRQRRGRAHRGAGARAGRARGQRRAGARSRAGGTCKPSGRLPAARRVRGGGHASAGSRRRESGVHLPRRERVLRRQARAQERERRHRAPPGAGDDRPVGLRQVDLPALPESHERHDPGRAGHRHDHSSTAGHPRPAAGRGAAARARRHGVPEAEPVSQVDLRQRRLRSAHPRAGGQPRASRRHRVHQPDARRACGTRSRTG